MHRAGILSMSQRAGLATPPWLDLDDGEPPAFAVNDVADITDRIVERVSRSSIVSIHRPDPMSRGITHEPSGTDRIAKDIPRSPTSAVKLQAGPSTGSDFTPGRKRNWRGSR